MWHLQASRKLPLFLRSAVRDIEHIPNYFDTKDSKAELADTIAGDNLVIIARRVN